MPATHAFERSHDILIDAPAEAVFDYVSNPKSWPEWLVASHHIDSADRPLAAGETFHEKWHTRSGEAHLDWVVRTCERPRLWVVETGAPFLGPIIVQYTCELAGGRTRYTRTVRNPARPKPATAEMIARIDEEARVALANIKVNVERRAGGAQNS